MIHPPPAMGRQLVHGLLLIGCGVAAAACGGDGARGGPDAGADAALPAPDGGLDGGGGADDAAAADGGPNSCAQVITLDTTFDLDPGGLPTQIHAAAAFDGDGVWVVYDTVEEGDTGLFDVWAVRLGCDGAPLRPPFRVNTTLPFNDVNPELAVAGDRFLVAWTSDDGEGGTDNMHAYVRLFSVDGEPLMASDAELRTTRGGAPLPDNHLGASVAADGEGFLVAGIRAVPDAERFQVFIQEVDAVGALAGEAIEPAFEAMVSQMSPAVATSGDGGAWAAWDRDDDASSQVYFRALGAGSPAAAQAVEGLATTSGVSLAVDAVDPTRVYAALGGAVIAGAGNLDMRLTDLGADVAGRPLERLGERGRDDFGPRIAAHPGGGGGLAWYRNVRGLDNELVLLRFTYDGSAFGLGAETVVASAAAPYQPALAHVRDDVFFVAWSEGRSPDFTLKGRFLHLAL